MVTDVYIANDSYAWSFHLTHSLIHVGLYAILYQRYAFGLADPSAL